MTKTYHLQIDIRGCLLHWKDRDFRGVFRTDDGRSMSAREAKAELLNQLAQGHKLISTGVCHGFDPHTGCPGHEQQEQRV